MSKDNFNEKNYNDMSNARIDAGYDVLDKAFEVIFNKHHLNFFEALTVLAMMDVKIKQNNISQYLIETVTRFQQKMNREDEEGK
ncbi:hypothetical protein LCGC14_0677120 [marine sediment metagenome]|uniref:Uncharacterized protein n=1 Tax=marine sediment metagenome TaxID=412755 RepID=A0A0F9TX88_9ZZZZ